MIWPLLTPWIALASALYGLFRREPVWIQFGTFMLVGAIYWKIR